MPRVDFKFCDRVYILKLICTAQMTYSSFVAGVYVYLMILQNSMWETSRPDIAKFKWGVIGACVLEFGLGTLLAFAANTPGIRGKQQIILWLILETFLVPISICLLMQLYYRIINAKEHFSTDPHYSRTNIAQTFFLLCQYIFITYTIDFLTHEIGKPKFYDPSIRPESVYAPTDPQITTTESRHIRMSQSFLWQPYSSKEFKLSDVSDDESSSKENSIQTEWSSREDMLSIIMGNEGKDESRKNPAEGSTSRYVDEGDEEKEMSDTKQDNKKDSKKK